MDNMLHFVRARLRWVIFGIACAAFLFSIYQIASYYSDEYRNTQKINRLKEIYYSDKSEENKPISPQRGEINRYPQAVTNGGVESANTSKTVQERFKQLLQTNGDVVGWLRIAETKVDYPVVQANDNEFYLTRDIQKTDNVNGSIFMDYRNNIKHNNKHFILYGHNMKNKSMFASLLNYESRWYMEQHPVIEFDTLYENAKWEIFSAYYTDIRHDYLKTEFNDAEQYKSFINDLKSRSLHKSDVEISEKDVILTLSTCSAASDQARFVVHAKLISSPQSGDTPGRQTNLPS